MSLDAAFTAAIAAMDSTTKSVQELVRIRPWIGEDIYGKVSYGATRKHKAVVDRTERDVRSPDGRVLHVTATVTFLKPLPVIGAPGRGEPIDVRDQLFLVDDRSGPIVSVRGSTNMPGPQTRYFQQVMLG